MNEAADLQSFAESYPLSTLILRELGRQMPFLLRSATLAHGTPLAQRLPRLEEIAERLEAIALNDHWVESSVRSYVVLSLEFITLQRKLEKSGRYLLSTEREAFERVYANENVFGHYYLSGLLLSEALWPNHHALVDAFDNCFLPYVQNGSRIVEIGVGTGYFLRRLLETAPHVAYLGVDISDVAVTYARRYALLNEADGHADFIIRNAMQGTGELDASFDAAICGEVLEHVEKPDMLLRELLRVVKPGGRLFVTTVVFAANIDHIYLFEDAASIRELIVSTGWGIERDWVLPINPDDSPAARKRPMNFGALLVRPA